MMYRMISFDLDGTLADTFPVILKSFHSTVKQLTGQVIDDQQIFDTFGTNEQGMLKKLLPNVSLDTASDVFYQAYEQAHQALRQPFPGVLNLLQALKDNGIQISLLTGKGQRSCDISLKMLGLTGYFKPILVGSPERNVKTDNLQSLLTTQHLAPNELAYVGDATSDIKAAQAANVHCFSAAWSSSVQLDALKTVNADIYEAVADLQTKLLN
ncbi:HAD family hydrolase [Secundilactobacillus hailunensis]|uniref:HAD family hydrolase n=1 Tax=Secundilactobacillus hailunensis TaxID=2559923 RepID=A0ABW1T770_9LACO|nr:HAD hydrolase-like protein [Secundilactobacillus hailunensis]